MAKIIPLHATLHYKCAFDIFQKHTPDDKPLIEQIITEIRDWTKSKISKAGEDYSDLYKPWYFRGVDLKKPVYFDYNEINQIRTASVQDSSQILSWFYEHIDQDLNEDSRAREWTTEITLNRTLKKALFDL